MRRRLAFLLRDFHGGGVQRSVLMLAGGFAERGHDVDVVTCCAEGPLAALVPARARLVVLEPGSRRLCRILPLLADPGGAATIVPALLSRRRLSPTVAKLGGLADYLRRDRPHALVSGLTQLNLEAVWAKQLAGWNGRLVLSERVHFSRALAESCAWRQRHLPGLVRRTYPRADAVVAVADALAQDLTQATGLPRRLVTTIYNAVVGPELASLAAEPVPHPWFADRRQPVILAAGRLTEQKDFATLIRAVAMAGRQRPVRLVILGEGERPEATAAARERLLALAAEHGVAQAVDLPGFVANPFAYMARAAVFALSSRLEGLPAVLIQAMACGCPVVSTDCPSGPREILDHGRFGALTAVADAPALAQALLHTLAAPRPREQLIARGRMFSVERAVAAYARLLGCEPGIEPARSAPPQCEAVAEAA